MKILSFSSSFFVRSLSTLLLQVLMLMTEVEKVREAAEDLCRKHLCLEADKGRKERKLNRGNEKGKRRKVDSSSYFFIEKRRRGRTRNGMKTE